MEGRPTPTSSEVAQLATPAYIVFDRSVVIAADLAETLRETGPCEVWEVHATPALESTLSEIDRLTAAFLDFDHAALVASGLDRELEARGARIVLTNSDMEAERIAARGWSRLRRPFTASMIRAMVS